MVAPSWHDPPPPTRSRPLTSSPLTRYLVWCRVGTTVRPITQSHQCHTTPHQAAMSISTTGLLDILSTPTTCTPTHTQQLTPIWLAILLPTLVFTTLQREVPCRMACLLSLLFTEAVACTLTPTDTRQSSVLSQRTSSILQVQPTRDTVMAHISSRVRQEDSQCP